MVIDALLADLLLKRVRYPTRGGLRKYAKLFANIFSTLGDLSKMLLGCGTHLGNVKFPLGKEKGIVVTEAVPDPCLEDCSLIGLLKASDLNFKPSAVRFFFTIIDDISFTEPTLNSSIRNKYDIQV